MVVREVFSAFGEVVGRGIPARDEARCKFMGFRDLHGMEGITGGCMVPVINGKGFLIHIMIHAMIDLSSVRVIIRGLRCI